VLTRDEYHAHLEQDSHAFLDTLRSSDLDASVPACPGWTLWDLGRHLGAVHRWALEIVRTGRVAELPEGPSERGELVAWMEEGAAALVTGLRASDAEAPTWTFGPKPRQASFWSRRQAHETAMHLVDAQQSAGIAHLVEPRLASDGIDEVIGVFFPRQVRLERIAPLTNGIRIAATDGSRDSWVLAGDGTDPAAATDATVSGTAADLLLALWGRAGLDDLSVDGDPAIVRTVLRAGITP
jgi:uncharacterized protein (TIGR03083 family)